MLHALRNRVMPYKDPRRRREHSKQYQKGRWKRSSRYRKAVKAERRILRERNAEFVNREKDQPCKDCGQRFPPYVMDFDHTGNDKIHAISFLVRNFASLERIRAEMNKCEVVCSNCHRMRTARRRANL